MNLSERLKQTSESVRRLNKVLTQEAIQYNLLVEQKNKLLVDISELTKKEQILHDACVILQESSFVSRNRLKTQIETIVTSALRDIIGDPTMGFQIVYDSSHNKVIADFYVTKFMNGETVMLDIMNECGGGIADIVSLAIRVVLLEYHSLTLSKILVLDEVCTSISNFSQEILSNLGKWLNMVSHQFDIQVILVTQKEELANEAGSVFITEFMGESTRVTNRS